MNNGQIEKGLPLAISLHGAVRSHDERKADFKAVEARYTVSTKLICLTISRTAATPSCIDAAAVESFYGIVENQGERFKSVHVDEVQASVDSACSG